jgi:hypothetical protein
VNAAEQQPVAYLGRTRCRLAYRTLVMQVEGEATSEIEYSAYVARVAFTVSSQLRFSAL